MDPIEESHVEKEGQSTKLIPDVMQGACMRNLREKLDNIFPWIITATSFTVQFFVLGFYKSFGPVYVKLLQPKHLGGLGGDSVSTSWVGSISICTSYLCTPISFEVIRRIKFRASMWLGAFLSGLGLFISAYADNVYILYVTFGMLFGMGSSLCYSASLLILPNYHTKYWALAHGIALAGNGLGGMGLSPANGILLERVGLKTGFKVMSLISFSVLFMCGCIYQSPPEKSEEELERERLEKQRELEEELDNEVVIDENEMIYPDSIWKNKPLLLFLLSTYLLNFGYYVPYVHLVKLSLDTGIPHETSHLLPGVLSLAQSVGKVFIGKVFSYGRVNRIRAYQVSLVALCLATTFVPVLKSATGLFAYAVLFGFSDGCGQATNMIIVGDLAGKKLLAKAYSTFLVCSASAFIVGPPIAGFVYSATGEYSIAFFMCGGMAFSSAILLFAVTCIRDEEQFKLRNELKMDIMKRRREAKENLESEDIKPGSRRDSGIDLEQAEPSDGRLISDSRRPRGKRQRTRTNSFLGTAARKISSKSSLDFNKEMLTRSWHSIEFKQRAESVVNRSRSSTRTRFDIVSEVPDVSSSSVPK